MDYTKEFVDLVTVSACLAKRDELLNSGEVLELKQKVKEVPGEEKKEIGARLNTIKQEVQASCDERIQAIQKEQEKDSYIEYDPTFYSSAYRSTDGHKHPISIVVEEIVEIFGKMGFDVFEGSLVESQWYNFTSVNTPDYHPARDMQDTFFLKQADETGQNYVMKTQVTASAVKYAKTHPAPFKVIFPGIVFRNENIDATHDINFTQFDMWMVDKDTKLSQLVGLIKKFFNEFFDQKDIKVRFRPSYFPFTQPSLEGDISCPFCGGEGCRICSQSGWIEVFGAGPIHKNVITNMGLDPEEYNGLAFGFGVDRLAQLKFGVSGVSQFYNGNLKFLRGRER